MIRGTTPTHIFELPIDTSIIDTGKIIYSQDGKVILEKAISECAMEGNTISIKLTQEDTFSFNCTKGMVYIQIRLLTLGKEVIASDEMKVEVKRCLDSEVLV